MGNPKKKKKPKKHMSPRSTTGTTRTGNVSTMLDNKELLEKIMRKIASLSVPLKDLHPFHGRFYYEDGTLMYEGPYLGTDPNAESECRFEHGNGKSYYKDGTLQYEGDYYYGFPHGQGRYYRPDGTLKWEGEFRGIPISPFTPSDISINVISAETEWERTSRIYEGKEYDSLGRRLYQGRFYLGYPIGPGFVYDSYGTPRVYLDGSDKDKIPVEKLLTLKELLALNNMDFYDQPTEPLTAEKRDELASFRLQSAYNCDNRNALLLKRELLYTVIHEPVDDKELMSAVYATLSSTELSMVEETEEKQIEESLSKCGAKAEPYARQALELNPTNTLAPICLVDALVNQEKLLEAMEVLAQYNVTYVDTDIMLPDTSNESEDDSEDDDSGEEDIWDDDVIAMFISEMKLDVLQDDLNRECKTPEKFQQYFAIHLRYPASFHYTSMLLWTVVANQVAYSRELAILCHNLMQYETVETAGASIYFRDRSNLLFQSAMLHDDMLSNRLLEELDTVYREHQEEVKPYLFIYYDNRLCILNQLGRYTEALDMAAEIKGRYRDNSILHYLTQAAVCLDRFSLAISYGRAAVALGGDNTDMSSLGCAYRGEQKYAEAVQWFKAAIGYIRSGGEHELFILQEKAIEKKLDNFQEDSYMTNFKMLIQIYMELGQYVEAEAAYQELCKLVPESQERNELRSMMVSQQERIEKSDEVQKACLRLKADLIATYKKIDDDRERIQEWSDKLIQCQILTDDEISDEQWESAMRSKMDDILDLICDTEETITKSHQKKFTVVKKRFPRLSLPLKKYLTTAEQLYSIFQDNQVVDLAPVLVEYCKVVEGALWAYLERSNEYSAPCAQWLQQPGHTKTLGSGCHIVEECGKPLYAFSNDLQQLKKRRNASARVGGDHRQAVEWVRELIWQSELLDQLT